MKFNKLAKLQATLVQKLQLTDRSKILLNHIPLWTYRVAQWLSQWGRFSISYHVKDLWNFSSPQKSVVSNIAFRKRLSIKYHWCWHFSLNSILRRWTHFEAWQLLNFQYSFQFCIHDFLSGYNWFVWPNLLPLLTICSDKKTIRVNTSYFSYLFPNKLMTTEIFQKWKENDLVVTHQISKKKYDFLSVFQH